VAKARILAVDDQLYFRSYIEGLLGEEGYSVVTADSGEACLGILAREGPFDVILTDLAMPGMDGVEMVQQVRERWPEQDLIMVTGVGDVRSAVEAVRMGAHDYLLKPIERQDLIRAIESVLEQRRLRREHSLLVSENLAYLGFLSAVERGLELLAYPRREEVAGGLLALLCLESRAQAGLFWVRERTPGGSTLIRRAACGIVRPEEEPERLEIPEERREALERGQVVHEAEGTEGDAAGPVLWVSAVREGMVWGVARLSDPIEGRFPASVKATCGKLGEFGAIAFANADRAEELERRALRDTRTGLHTPSFLEDAVAREIHRGNRYGRTFVLLCLEVAEPILDPDSAVVRGVAAALERALRPTDVVATAGPARFWLLIPEADPLGGAVIKRRLTESVGRELGGDWPLCMGSASFPIDGDVFEKLGKAAADRLQADRTSLVRALNRPTPSSLSWRRSRHGPMLAG
jgi:FixJ family two-component response regulator/GGDEF domain-containing protein